MKLWILFLFTIVLCSFTTCEDDEAPPVPVCDQAAYVGSYTGDIDCGDGTTAPTVVQITAEGNDSVRIEYNRQGQVRAFIQPLEVNSCELSRNNSVDGFLLAFTIVTLSGDDITIREVDANDTSERNCLVTATRDD